MFSIFKGLPGKPGLPGFPGPRGETVRLSLRSHVLSIFPPGFISVVDDCPQLFCWGISISVSICLVCFFRDLKEKLVPQALLESLVAGYVISFTTYLFLFGCLVYHRKSKWERMNDNPRMFIVSKFRQQLANLEVIHVFRQNYTCFSLFCIAVYHTVCYNVTFELAWFKLLDLFFWLESLFFMLK